MCDNLVPLVGTANCSLVLSFPAIVEILLEDEYEQKNGHREDGPASAHLVSAASYYFAQAQTAYIFSRCTV
jgi:hypothetical protein